MRITHKVAATAVIVFLATLWAVPANAQEVPIDWGDGLNIGDEVVEVPCQYATKTKEVVGGELVYGDRFCDLSQIFGDDRAEVRELFTSNMVYHVEFNTGLRTISGDTRRDSDGVLEQSLNGGGFGWSRVNFGNHGFEESDFVDSFALCSVPNDPFITLVCEPEEVPGMPSTTWHLATHRSFIHVMGDAPGVGWAAGWMRGMRGLGGIEHLASRGYVIGLPPWVNTR